MKVLCASTITKRNFKTIELWFSFYFSFVDCFNVRSHLHNAILVFVYLNIHSFPECLGHKMQRTTPLMVEWVVEMWKASNWCNKPCYLESMTRLSGSSDFQWCNSKVQCDWLDTQIQKKTTKPQQQRSHFLLFRPRFEFRYDWTPVTLYLVRASTRLHNFWWYYLSAQAENKLKAHTCPILCHNEIHGTSQEVSQSFPFFIAKPLLFC